MAVRNFVSIQVQPTILTGRGAELVSIKNGDSTHWSIYLRKPEGTVEWLEDIAINKGNPGTAFSKAHIRAAELSMQYQLPIEKVF
ncbi:hypothetical protein CNR34_00117 [Pseudomonas phage nickie]|uniref:Uncharacterized protein n=1 Tax=Pseudomonas phage nickie TaxID=2048977 RepID=A0A2H4P7N8_9CAUD|nr:hypothetical protein FDJ16_gp048 [Pseudomonas phage nickie]ATW58050.1 hypothetical protein CNR34_00117 [Pseudomonas phage nickie]